MPRRTHRESAPPAPPELLLIQIRALLPSLSPAEARVAREALRDPAGVAASTIGTVANRCETSETTVVRFSRALGLRGYPELRVALATAAGRSAQSARPELAGEISIEDPLPDLVAKVCFADAQAIEDTAAQLDVDVLDAVAERISVARRIDLYGVGASAFAALDLQQKLHRIGFAVFAWLDPNVMVTSATLLGHSDVAIGISHTGASRDTLAALDEARSAGAQTVAVTSFPRSPLARQADFVLTTASRETTFRSGAMASRVAQLSVIDCIFVAVAQRRYDETLLALHRTYRAVAPRRIEDAHVDDPIPDHSNRSPERSRRPSRGSG